MTLMTRTLRLAAYALPLAGLLLAGRAHAAAWEIDSSHSSAQFSVRHLMVSNVRGEFGKVTGTVDFDAKDPSKAKVEATIDAGTINTREQKRDEHLKSPDFFDVAKYPTITFKSKKVVAAGAGKLKVTGDLTIHGVTKEVTLDVEGPAMETKDPWGNQRTGAQATTKINRKDFGLKWNKVLDGGGVAVGDEVTITIDVEMTKKVDKAAKPAK
jgi:polyisoprenoid-binding protein YceI